MGRVCHGPQVGSRFRTRQFGALQLRAIQRTVSSNVVQQFGDDSSPLTNRALIFEFESNLESDLFNSNECPLLKSVITNDAKEMCRTTLFLTTNLKHIKLPAYDHS